MRAEPATKQMAVWRAAKSTRWLIVIWAGMLLAGCTTVLGPVASDPLETSPTTAAQHAAIVEAYGGVYRDADLERTLTRIVSRLVTASSESDRTYAITILNAAAVNAFALPDGYLYVTRGLLTLASDSSEVAAVFAHEMAHITADHAAERRDRALTAAIVDAAVGDVVRDPAVVQTAVATSQQTLASFSRQQELEADLIGIATVAEAGYDPYAAARFLTSMSRYEQYRLSIGVRQDLRPAFLASHPSNEDRINAAIAAATEFGPAGTSTADRDRFLSALDEVVFGDDVEQGFVRGRVFYHADLAIGFAVADGFVLDNTQEAVLATSTDGTALRFDAVALSRGDTPVDYMLSGWINGLDEGSVEELTINGLPAASASAAAAGWHFRITIVQVGNAAYRFIFANDEETTTFDQVAAAISSSFRRLTAQEAANLRPLRIEIVTVGGNDSLAQFAADMTAVDAPIELLSILNGLQPGAPPTQGSKIKIVTD